MPASSQPPEHLSHLSWGADRETLMHLYTALVKSKLDYGAQVYGAHETKALSRLDPIQNACLRACTGAFRSSPSASLCVEAGVPPLKYSRDILALNNFFKCVALPNTPTHKALVGMPQEETPPKRELINNLLNQYQLNIPEVVNIKISETPPWTHNPIKVCDFVKVNKANKHCEEMKADFLGHLGKHQTTHIYTDGSKTAQHVGYAAVAGNHVTCGSLPKEASIFTAELYAIKAAINELVLSGEVGEQFTIFSDSRSALLALQKSKNCPPIITEIKELLQRTEINGLSLEMCWVPGHTNIEGNEKADTAAKNAATEEIRGPPRAILHSDMKRVVRDAVFSHWQQHWNSLIQEGQKLREIKQSVKRWKSSQNKCRRVETILSRLRIGHTNITHSYLMQGQADPPECERCRRTLTVKHLLLECPKFTATRTKYFGNQPTLADILSESNSFSANKIISFLRETNLI